MASVSAPLQIDLSQLSFDPQGQAPRVHASLDITSYQAGETGLFLVQWNGPIRAEDKTQLSQLGVELGDYIPDFAFVARATQDVAEQVAKLPFIRAVSLYKPAYKVAADLLGKDGAVRAEWNGQNKTILRLVGFNGAAVSAIAKQVTALGGTLVADTADSAVAELPLSVIPQVAALSQVVSIHPVQPFQLLNEKATGVIKVDQVRGGSLNLDGSGQIVAVADTGLDTGRNDSSMHQDFQGRIQQIFPWGRPNDSSDNHGHGTHVAGSILGTGARSGGQHKGMAPGAKLVFQSVMDGQGQLAGLPNDLGQLFGQAYQAGARIHSDSWGSEVNGGYDGPSRDVDKFVWEHPDMAILIAAGNSGSNRNTGGTNYQSIASPGTAKNAITVGASENNRPEQGSLGDNVNQIASFSSRGPTADGRVKPDIVAPGSWVLSVKSSQASDSNFWKPYNQYYAYMGGTSMATPITAGAVALVRQYYTDKLHVTPTASLLKATLINGAVDMGFGPASRDQGWGRIDVKNSIAPDGKQVRFENEPAALSTGEAKEYSITVKAGQPFRTTLVWTDYPASPSAGKTLVNDLDLEVVAPSGQVYAGNDFAAPFNDKIDRVNNVENVWISAPEAGTYKIRVKGYNIPQGPQRFSLVYSGNFDGAGSPSPDPNPNPPKDPNPGDKEAPQVVLNTPQNGAIVSGNVVLSAGAEDNVGVTKVEFLVDGNVIQTVTAAPYRGSWDTTTIPDGQHRVTARAYDAAGNVGTSAEAVVTVQNGAQPNPPEQPIAGDVQSYNFSGQSIYTRANRYFYFDVSRAGTITAQLSWTGNGQAGVTLTDPTGKVVAEDIGDANPKKVTFQVQNPGRYRVRLATSGIVAYKLDVTHPVDPAQIRLETRTGQIATGARDEFEVTVPRKGALNISLDWDQAQTDLDLYVYHQSGNLVGASNLTAKPEAVSVPVQEAGTYHVVVHAYNGNASYQARITLPK